jgi:hypothetical protein
VVLLLTTFLVVLPVCRLAGTVETSFFDTGIALLPYRRTRKAFSSSLASHFDAVFLAVVVVYSGERRRQKTRRCCTAPVWKRRSISAQLSPLEPTLLFLHSSKAGLLCKTARREQEASSSSLSLSNLERGTSTSVATSEIRADSTSFRRRSRVASSRESSPGADNDSFSPPELLKEVEVLRWPSSRQVLDLFFFLRRFAAEEKVGSTAVAEELYPLYRTPAAITHRNCS